MRVHVGADRAANCPLQPVTIVRRGAIGFASFSMGWCRSASERSESSNGIGHWMCRSGSARFTNVYVFFCSRLQCAFTRYVYTVSSSNAWKLLPTPRGT